MKLAVGDSIQMESGQAKMGRLLGFRPLPDSNNQDVGLTETHSGPRNGATEIGRIYR